MPLSKDRKAYMENVEKSKLLKKKEDAHSDNSNGILKDDSGKKPEKLKTEDLMLERIDELNNSMHNLESKVAMSLSENASLQMQIRQCMQKEIEEMHDKLKGEAFLPILKEIAEIYIEWQSVIAELEDPKAKSKVEAVFSMLREIMEEYGCNLGRSEIGTKRNTKISKLKAKIYVDSADLHETVAKSYNEWIVNGPYVIYPEYVDVNVYCKGKNN